jgi:hypothetical protein
MLDISDDGKPWFKLLVVVCMMAVSVSSLGWVYPEHRMVTLRAIGDLDPERRSVLDHLWSMARRNYERRLSESVIDRLHTATSTHIDFAAWPAIAGDHSCSAESMLRNVLESSWIMDVTHVAVRLEKELAESEGFPHARVNALRDSDVQFQRADEEYATRAGSNNVHFLLARPSVTTDGMAYGHTCFSEGSEINALGAYMLYHLSAFRKAARISDESLSELEKSKLALAALADEAFALHFLQDAFAAGHVAGTWGNASLPKLEPRVSDLQWV